MIVTHNMQQASRVSDSTAFFNIAGTGKPGKLIEYDDTTTIFSNAERAGDRGLRLGPLRLSGCRVRGVRGPGRSRAGVTALGVSGRARQSRGRSR